MSTATTDPAAPIQIPAKVWQKYRLHRAEGSDQRVCTSMALEGTSGRGRERLADALIAREAADGLALTPEEIEAEIAAEAEGREAESIAPEPGSAEAIGRDARARAGELREAIERMAPEVLTDPKIAAEQKDAESELAACELVLENLARARGEIARREKSAAQEAEQAAREQADTQAREMQPAIHVAAEAVDAAAGAFADTVVAYRDLKGEQAVQLLAAGYGQEAGRGRSYRPSAPARALHVALRERGVRVEGIEGRNQDQPLAAGEPSEWV